MSQKRGKKEKFEPKELVLAKMHGFPAWPSFVMPLNIVPDAILRAKKKTTNFCVIFIPDGDFYWMNEKSLEALSADLLDKKLEKIPAKQSKKKATGRTLHVNEALAAARGLDFDDFMKRLDMSRAGDDDDDDEEDEEDEEEEDEEAEEKEEEEDLLDAKVKEENDTAADSLDADDEEDEDDEDDEDVAISGRRARSLKRRATSTPQPLPKRRTKSEQPKTPPSNGDTSNHKRSGLTSASSESSPKVSTNEERQHQLWLCRIKLQRTLIQRNQPATPSDPKKFPPPTVDELLVARLILNRLGDFPMTVDFLKSTKIHKVLKCIVRDRDLEYSDSFKLHEKCEELLAKWATIIEKLRNEKFNSVKKLSGMEKSVSNNDDSEVSGIDTSLPLKNGNNKEVMDGISAKT